MAEFQEIFREAQRMCGTYDECYNGCPLYDDENYACMFRDLYEGSTKAAAKIEHIIMNWATAQQSWDDAWQSLFSNTKLNTCPCPMYFGEECPAIGCDECKQRPISKEVAEKLGIKPREEGKR